MGDDEHLDRLARAEHTNTTSRAVVATIRAG
jgi:hypothetical protein